MNFLPAGAEGYQSDDSDEFHFGDDHEDNGKEVGERFTANYLVAQLVPMLYVFELAYT